MAKFKRSLHAVGLAAQFALSDSDCMEADSWSPLQSSIRLVPPPSDWLIGLGRLIRTLHSLIPAASV